MSNQNNDSIIVSTNLEDTTNSKTEIRIETDTSLVRVNPAIDSHAKFLYKLLKERSPENNISNRTIKTWKDHLNFIDYNNPYSDWYIIKNESHWIGSIYLTQRNEIGIYVMKKFRGKKFGRDALKLLIHEQPRRFYYSNVNPDNEDLKKFFEKFFGKTNYKLVEMCYEIVQERDS